MKPLLVGGLVDRTSSTLMAPDLDYSLQWELKEELINYLHIKPTDQGESGQYTLQVWFASSQLRRLLHLALLIAPFSKKHYNWLNIEFFQNIYFEVNKRDICHKFCNR